MSLEKGGFDMTGHRPFSELTKDCSPERKAKIEAETNRLLEEITLRELREALHIQQLDVKRSQPTLFSEPSTAAPSGRFSPRSH